MSSTSLNIYSHSIDFSHLATGQNWRFVGSLVCKGHTGFINLLNSLSPTLVASLQSLEWGEVDPNKSGSWYTRNPAFTDSLEKIFFPNGEYVLSIFLKEVGDFLSTHFRSMNDVSGFFDDEISTINTDYITLNAMETLDRLGFYYEGGHQTCSLSGSAFKTAWNGVEFCFFEEYFDAPDYVEDEEDIEINRIMAEREELLKNYPESTQTTSICNDHHPEDVPF